MSEAITIALIGIVPSVLVAIVSIVSNNAIVKVKIEELEKHVNKHNQVIERTYTEHYDLFEGTCAEWKVKHEEYKPTEGFLNVCWGFGCAFVMIEICLLILLVAAIIFSAISECTFIDDIIRWINDGEDR